MKKVLFVAAEATPFIKTGGLGDVIGSLPVEMAKESVDARVIIPWYRDIPDEYKNKAEKLGECTVKIAWRQQKAVIWKLNFQNTTFYFIDHPYYFDRSGCYGYFDDGERFAFFSRAVVAVLDKLDFIPDIIHANDWHTALIPVYIKHNYAQQGHFKKIKTVFTIHNLLYQGQFTPDIVEDLLGLDWGYYTSDKLEFNKAINLMKGGILYADAITTVSKTYAKEVQGLERGEGLDGVLRACSSKFIGILNGIDYELYDPTIDKTLKSNFDSYSKLPKRKQNKKHLFQMFNFDSSLDAPIVSLITRLVSSKGLDLFCEVLPGILSSGAKVIILGTGEAGYETHLKYMASNNKDNMVTITEFNDSLARQIYAGSDIFLMPSLFEPCGTSQMVAMRYGSIPLVHETGGLIDTVEPYNKFTKKGTGFGFKDMTPAAFFRVYNEALDLYRDQKQWQSMIKRAMRKDFSWGASVKEYVKLYENILKE